MRPKQLKSDSIKEYAKGCLFATSGIENNFSVFDGIARCYVPFILFPKQKELEGSFEKW